MMALLSGAIVPEGGFIVHCAIFKPASSLAPFPAFFAYFFTYLAYFFAPFFGSAATGAEILLAAYNFVCLSFSTFARSSFLNYSLAKSKRQ
jgi:hypothetical protein